MYRYDGFKNAICLSLGHPNYKMLYSLRIKHPSIEWVVLGVKPNILWEKDCAFCTSNAAKAQVTQIPIQKRKGLVAFNSMFLPITGKPSRQDLKLPDYCPTDPQAEVLLFDTILPNDIAGVVVPSKKMEAKLSLLYPSFSFLYHRAFYSARLDYAYW